MPGGRGANGRLPRSVGVLATAEPSADPLAGAIVARLRAALPSDTALTFYATRPSEAQHDLPVGVRRAASPADLAARAGLLIMAVPDLELVRELIDGPAGIQAGVHSPTIQVVGAVCAPEDLRHLAAQLDGTTAGRLLTVDAPLVGPPADILAGRLPVLAGAPRTVFDAAAPVLSLLGPTTCIGGIGHGQIAAASTRFLMASTMAAVVEAGLVARRSGVDQGPLLASWQHTDVLRRAVEEVASRLLGLSEEFVAPDSWSASLDVTRAEAVRTRTRTALLDAVLTAYAEVAGSSEPEDDLVRRLERMVSNPRGRPSDS